MSTTTLPPSEATTTTVVDIQSAASIRIETRESAKQKSFWQLLNISIGFLGIQFAWMIQMGQMSPLLESLGSAAWLTSIIWCAGPVTGIVVQPIVGSLSDRTWTFLGRRRPFLLLGAVLTAICLVLMPNSPSLIIAASLLWILDASINISQGPYRALVPDVVPKSQQAFTYTLMGFTIGLGSVAASFIGYVVPDMHYLFYLGALSMLACMIWTILTTPEEKRESLQASTPDSPGFGSFIRQTWSSIMEMPQETKKLCLMHSFTWFGWQCLFIFFSLYVIHNLFGAQNSNSPVYQEAGKHVFLCYAVLNSVCFIVSPFLGKLCDHLSKRAVHTIGLLCLGLAMISTLFLTNPVHAVIAMGIIGIGWATTLSVPFAILAGQVPPGKEGVLMGTFNIFIAAPQFFASALAGLLVTQTHNDASALVLGGISVLLSAILLQRVKE